MLMMFEDEVVDMDQPPVTYAPVGCTRTGVVPDGFDELRRSRRLSATLAITAPMGGTVLGRQAVPGERVAQSAPLFTIAQLRPLWISLQVPLARATLLENTGQVSLPTQGATGRLIRVGRSVDAGTQSITAIAEITEGAERLHPGEAVTVTVSLQANDLPAWRLPASAVIRHRERHWIFVRVPEGFRARTVTLLSETAQSVAIRAELDPQDRVASRGILALLAELVAADGE